jgi:TRAP-type transport system periplasmic protein
MSNLFYHLRIRATLTIAIVLVVAMILTACSTPSTPSQTNAPSKPATAPSTAAVSTTAASSQTTPATAANAIKLRMATRTTATEPRSVYMQNWANEVNKQTNGRISIQIFFSGSLLDDKAMVSGLPAGAADVGFPSFGMWFGIAPKLSLAFALGIFDGKEHLWRSLQGELGQEIATELEQKGNVKLLCWLFQGPSDAILFRKGPITKPGQVAGLKMRVPDAANAIAADAYKAEPTIIASPEVYQALSLGTVDGVFTTPAGAIVQKWAEVAPFITRYSLFPDSPNGIAMNLDVWKKLSASDQKLIMDLAKQQIEDVSKAQCTKEADQYWAQLKAMPKVNLFEVPTNELSQWKDPAFTFETNLLRKTIPDLDRLLAMVNKAR